jgi:hypothetical protein
LRAGGRWLPVTLVALAFAAVVVFGPVVLARLDMPQPWANHKAAMALAADTAMLPALVAVAKATGGALDRFWNLAVPAMAPGVALAWMLLAVIRYLPLPGLYRAATASSLGAVVVFFLPQHYNALAGYRGWRDGRPIDLRIWDQAHINGNIDLIVALACLVVAVILLEAAVGVSWAKRRRGRRDDLTAAHQAQPGAGLTGAESAPNEAQPQRS